MKLVWNKSGLIKNLNKKSNVLIDEPTVNICSDLPYLDISISSNDKVFIWGEVYFSDINKERQYNNISLIKEKIRNILKTKDASFINNFLNGNYIGIHFNKLNKNIFIFGDIYTRTELFYINNNDTFYASTDLGFLIENNSKQNLSQVALSNFLSVYGFYAPKCDTIYKNIKRLAVNQTIRITKSDINFETKEFNPNKILNYKTSDLKIYWKIFRESILDRISDGVNWVFLSSGWDSTSILAVLAKELGPKRVRGVIGRMKYSKRAGVINEFEIKRAKQFADYYKIKLDIVDFDLTTNECIDYWENIIPTLRSQHIYSFSALNFSKLLEFVKSNGSSNDSIFAGEISDGLHNFGFSQSATVLEHPVLEFREYSDKMASYLFGPTFFSSILNKTYESDFVYLSLKNRIGHDKFTTTSNDTEQMVREKYFLSLFARNVRMPFFSSDSFSLLTKKGKENLDQYLLSEYLSKPAKLAKPNTLYSWLIHLYNSFHWQGGTVRCFGANLYNDGGRVKFPFWDERLINFISKMPEDWGRGLEMKPTKYPLKWCLENVTDYPIELQKGPHSYLYDVDPSFNHVSEILFGSKLSELYKAKIKETSIQSILSEEHFNIKYINTIIDQYLDGKELYGQERSDLMAIGTLCLIGWYK